MSTDEICDCDHYRAEHTDGPEEGFEECIVEGCECMEFTVGEWVDEE